MSTDFQGISISSEDPATRFDFEAKVGEGSYGAVYKAIDRVTGQQVAVKVLDLQGDDAQVADLRREINILQSCRSTHIVNYSGAFVKDGQLWIAMEYCGAGSLSDLMAICETTLSELEIAAVMYQSLLGLDYLHSTKKIHRDIKSGNILLTDDGVCKLADFGVSAELNTTMAKARTMIGTPYFMAPEVLMNVEYDNRADIWSIGITAYELAVGQPPLADVHPMRAIFQIPNSPPPRLPGTDQGFNFSKEFQQFIELCLQKSPADRYTAKKLLNLPFFKHAQSEAASVKIVNSLLLRCKHAIDEWRLLEQQEQAQLNINNPYNQGGGQELGGDLDTSGTVAITPQHQQQFESFDQATMRRTDAGVAQNAQNLRQQSNPINQYNNDGTMIVKRSPVAADGTMIVRGNAVSTNYDQGTVVRRPTPGAAAAAAYDQGTVVINPSNNQPHFGSLKVGKNANSGTANFNSGTLVVRPGAGQMNADLPLGTANVHTLMNTINATSTKADIQRVLVEITHQRQQDFNAVSSFYTPRVSQLEALLARKP